MLFFRKSSVAEVKDIGQVKLNEEQGFIPYVGVLPSTNRKVYNIFFDNNSISKGEFMYVKALHSVLLNLQSNKHKVGISFNIRKHLKPLAGIMKTGMIAIRDNYTDRMVSFDLTPIKDTFSNEWREKIIHDIIDWEVKEYNLIIENMAEYRKTILAHLAENWMVER